MDAEARNSLRAKIDAAVRQRLGITADGLKTRGKRRGRRRRLDDGERRIIALELQLNPERTNDEVARAYGVSARTVAAIRREAVAP